jgi:hypothetical protein
MAYGCARMEESTGSSDVVGKPLTVTKSICSAQIRHHSQMLHLSENRSTKGTSPCLWPRPKERVVVSECMPSLVTRALQAVGYKTIVGANETINWGVIMSYEHIMTPGPWSHSRNSWYCRHYWRHYVNSASPDSGLPIYTQPRIWTHQQWGKQSSNIKPTINSNFKHITWLIKRETGYTKVSLLTCMVRPRHSSGG